MRTAVDERNFLWLASSKVELTVLLFILSPEHPRIVKISFSYPN